MLYPSPAPWSIPCFFLFTATATTEIYTLSLHDALPISDEGGEAAAQPAHAGRPVGIDRDVADLAGGAARRSEEHTSELQSRRDLVCRLLLEKKNQSYGWCC